MLQRLPIAPVQVKTGNTSENLLNEIRQIIYSLSQVKEIIEKVYSNIKEFNKVIKLEKRVDTLFMNSKNSKTSDLHRLLLNLLDKVNLRRSDKYVLYQIL